MFVGKYELEQMFVPGPKVRSGLCPVTSLSVKECESKVRTNRASQRLLGELHCLLLLNSVLNAAEGQCCSGLEHRHWFAVSLWAPCRRA